MGKYDSTIIDWLVAIGVPLLSTVWIFMDIGKIDHLSESGRFLTIPIIVSLLMFMLINVLCNVLMLKANVVALIALIFVDLIVFLLWFKIPELRLWVFWNLSPAAYYFFPYGFKR